MLMKMDIERPKVSGANGMTSDVSIDAILAESEREASRYQWEGKFSDYLRLVVEDPSVSRLSHALIYEAIKAAGMETSTDGTPVYGLFEGEIFGLEKHMDRVVQYFAASAQRMEVRKRILLLLGPPASGKSSVVGLIKRALEEYTRSDAGAVYAIRGCPMQEEPLHLVAPRLRSQLLEKYGIHVEGDLCPRCRYMLRVEYEGKVSEVPVRRVTYSEQEAVGIGYYVATNPNPTDSSLLVGSVDTSQLEGDRLEVAGKAFRLDGEFNVANRGMIEFVEMFKADRHLLTTLLGLAQEQVIKMEKFGSLYADEVIIGHSNEGDFSTFASDEASEALKDRIIAVHIPYNLRVSEEEKIFQKMLRESSMEGVHLAPLTLRVSGIYAVLSRLEDPPQGISRTDNRMDKLRLYDGQMVARYTRQDVVEMQRHNPNEGMSGLSPRYVMNRLGAVASQPDVTCILPLAALDSMWEGMHENVSLDQADQARYVGFVEETVKEYSRLAKIQVQRAYEESFEQAADLMLEGYLANITAFITEADGHSGNEREMREIERPIGITEGGKKEFRHELYALVSTWERKGRRFEYSSDARLEAAIEKRLFPDDRKVERGLSQPRFAKARVEWASRRSSVVNRLVSSYGYCARCAEDLVNYVPHVLKNRPVVKTPKNEGVEWEWPLDGHSEPGSE